MYAPLYIHTLVLYRDIMFLRLTQLGRNYLRRDPKGVHSSEDPKGSSQ